MNQPQSEKKPLFSEREMEIARETDLPDLLEYLGYSVRRVGRYYTTKEMDSLRIRNRRTWTRYSTRQHGDAITFVQEFCGKSFVEAVEFLLEFHGKTRDPPALKREAEPEERPPFALPIAWHDQRRVFAYLRGRGIAAQVIEGFIRAGLLYEDALHHNCVFVGRNREGEPVFANKRSTCTLNGYSFKGDEAGSDKNVAFRLPCDPEKDWVTVFEAPIDLMSFFTVIHAKELRAADGFVNDGGEKTITIKSGDVQELTFYNAPCGTLKIVKRDRATGAVLKGAEFEISYANGEFVGNYGGAVTSNGVYTTDERGQIVITGLQPCVLTIRETKAPAGHILDAQPRTVTVNAGDTQTIEIFNDATRTLTIQKYITGTTKPIAGVKFLITDSSGAILGPNNGEYVTDRNGRIVLTGLTPGVTITAKELEAAEGFVLDTSPQSTANVRYD